MNPILHAHGSEIQAKIAGATFFASPERAALGVVQQQLLEFSAHAGLMEVLNATAEIIFILNPDRQVVFLNSEAVEALGLDASTECIGRRFGEIADCIHAHEMPGGCGTSRACSQCGQARAILTSLKGTTSEEECRITRSGQRESLDLLVRSVALDITGGRYLVLTIRDISDMKRRQSLERIFFHDILNTAGSLSGYAELLVDAKGRDIDEFQATIQSLADQVLEEIQAQQNLVLAEHGELTPVMRPVTTDSLIRSTARRFERMAEAQGKSIRIAPMEERLVVCSDEVLLRRVLGNMVKNAVEATRTGAAITIGCSVNGSRARFWVQNAESMTQSVQLQVFKRSFSTKGSNRGLGTYSMKLLVERYLGGQVMFESSKERGTIFCADIPLSPAIN